MKRVPDLSALFQGQLKLMAKKPTYAIDGADLSGLTSVNPRPGVVSDSIVDDSQLASGAVEKTEEEPRRKKKKSKKGLREDPDCEITPLQGKRVKIA